MACRPQHRREEDHAHISVPSGEMCNLSKADTSLPSAESHAVQILVTACSMLRFISLSCKYPHSREGVFAVFIVQVILHRDDGFARTAGPAAACVHERGPPPWPWASGDAAYVCTTARAVATQEVHSWLSRRGSPRPERAEGHWMVRYPRACR